VTDDRHPDDDRLRDRDASPSSPSSPSSPWDRAAWDAPEVEQPPSERSVPPGAERAATGWQQLSFPPPPVMGADPVSSPRRGSDRVSTDFPPIPWGSPSAPAATAVPPAADRRPRVAVVAMVAALLGALLGTGASLAYVDSRLTAAGDPQAAPVAAGDLLAPTIEVNGEDLDGVDRVAGVAEAVLPTVVQINIRGSAGPLGGRSAGNGSGVVYRSDGHIITNNHVVAGGGDLEVLFSDGERLDAEIVGTDADTDLAVIKVDRSGLTSIQIGDSSSLRVGELAVAVGSPFGLEGTVTAGVVSSLNRQIRVGGPDGAPLTLPNVIQTDAPINPGNSGGALVNGGAELIGINSAILTQGGTAANAGVGFAIPVSIATEVAEQLISRGFVQHPFLGVAGSDVTSELAERMGVDDGALVEQVVPGTPAAEAGIREGDIITTVAGEAVDSMQDLIAAILRQAVGDAVDITYIRGGQESTTEVTLAEKPRS
jgi:S1-C subfamily serine protease